MASRLQAGSERYLRFVLIAHLPLTHLAATASGAEADLDKTKPLDLPNVPRLQSLLRSKIRFRVPLSKLSIGGKKLQERILLSTMT